MTAQTYYIECASCRMNIETTLTDNQLARIAAWSLGTTEPIQNILPDLPVEIREMLVSGICSRCWDIMWVEAD